MLRNFFAGTGLGPMLVRTVAGSAGLRVAGMGLGFLVGVQLARGLGPSGYGVYGVAMAILVVLMIPIELGVPLLITREVAAARARDGHGATAAMVRWARGWVGGLSLLVAGLVWAGLALDIVPIDASVARVLLLGLLWMPIIAIGNIYDAALRGSQMIVVGQLGELLIRPAIVSLLLLLVSLGLFGGLSPALAMLLNIAAALAAAAFSVMVLTRSPAYSRAEPGGGDLRISQALPMGMSEGMRILSGQLGVVLLGFMVVPGEVGLYRVALGIYIVTTMPSALINATCSPVLARLHAQGRKDALVRLNFWIAALLLVASLLFLAFGAVLGSSLIATLFGEQYRAAGDVLTIFLGGEVIASLFGLPSVVLNMLGAQRIVMLWSGAALAVNAVLTVFLVKAMGYTGAAIGCMAGTIAWRAACAVHAKARLGLDVTPLTMLVPSGAKT